MARRTDTPTEPVKADKKWPKYDVVKVTRNGRASGEAAKEAEDNAPLRPGDTLTIIELGVEAKTQLDAADAAVERLPKGDRNGEFGAFLSGSFKRDEWETETTVITRRKSRAK